MQDISLHLLDIIENSVRAKADTIWLSITKNINRDLIRFVIQDNGCGMDSKTIEKALNPFYSSKEARVKKIGLGIPLFKQNAELAGGSFSLTSELGSGTEVQAVFGLSHIDRMPLGNIADTLITAIIGHLDVDFCIKFELIGEDEIEEFVLNTIEVKKELGDVPLNYPEVITFLTQMLIEGAINTELEEV